MPDKKKEILAPIYDLDYAGPVRAPEEDRRAFAKDIAEYIKEEAPFHQQIVSGVSMTIYRDKEFCREVAAALKDRGYDARFERTDSAMLGGASQTIIVIERSEEEKEVEGGETRKEAPKEADKDRLESKIQKEIKYIIKKVAASDAEWDLDYPVALNPDLSKSEAKLVYDELRNLGFTVHLAERVMLFKAGLNKMYRTDARALCDERKWEWRFPIHDTQGTEDSPEEEAQGTGTYALLARYYSTWAPLLKSSSPKTMLLFSTLEEAVAFAGENILCRAAEKVVVINLDEMTCKYVF